MFFTYVPSRWMDPYAVNMISSNSVAIHISLLYASMVAHMQNLFMSFIVLWSIPVGLLWTLFIVGPWVEFGIRYHDFMII